jgi:hypothetical protein
MESLRDGLAEEYPHDLLTSHEVADRFSKRAINRQKEPELDTS